MSNLKLADCESVFLDTGPIIDALRVGSADPRHALALQLFKHLSETKSSTGRVRKFYLSAISISEIATLSDDSDMVVKLAKVLNVGNLEIVAFDKRIAIRLNSTFSGLLSKKAQNAFVEAANKMPGNLLLAREWINRDMMIAATAAAKNVDVVFTTDSKTFKPIAERAGLFCVPMNANSFHSSQGEDTIMEFDQSKLKSSV